nr:MAG TPA: hypothetical protein [Caudoviricetes sp.]
MIPSSSIGRFPIKPSRICRSCTANTRAAISLGLPVIFTVTLFSPFISLSPAPRRGFFMRSFSGRWAEHEAFRHPPVPLRNPAPAPALVPATLLLSSAVLPSGWFRLIASSCYTS